VSAGVGADRRGGVQSATRPERGSFESRWRRAVAAELAYAQLAPGGVLGEADLAGLPDPVRRYVVASGAVGRPVPRAFRLDFEAVMSRRPGDRLVSSSRQVNAIARPARLFLMRSRMFGLPVRALHLYRGEAATFQVRVAGLLSMADESGDAISRAETVTVLNDMTVFAPGTLADPRLAWEAVDDRSARVAFTNGRWRVEATLHFNDADELVDFWSDDRPETIGRETFGRRWRTPLDAYGVVDGIRVATHGLAVYEHPDGPFTYGEFTLRSLRYDPTVAEALA
jgi:hypothetical protein